MDTNELSVIVKESGLETSQVDNLMRNYAGSFQEAKKIVSEFKSIVVSSEDQLDLMKKAKEGRKKLKDIRVEVEKTRIKLKEQSLREGKAIDGMANIIKALIIPVEEHLEKQEKYIELKEAKRLSDRYGERVEKLSKYVEDVSLYNLTVMSDEAFDSLLTSSKNTHVAKLKEQDKIEAEAIERQKKEKTYNDRRIELAPYNQFRGEKDSLRISLDTTEKEYQIILKKCKDLKSDYDKKQEEIRLENEELRKKSEKDRKAKEEVELKLKKEQEARGKKEKAEKDAADAKKKLEDEEKLKKLLAPDKDKLRELWKVIDNIEYPKVGSKVAYDIIEETANLISKAKDYLVEKSKEL